MSLAALKANAKWLSIWSMSRMARGRLPTALMYHSISDSPSLFFSVPPRRFADQLERLAGEGAEFLALDQVAEAYAARRALPERSVCVTFDDGYRDNLTVALPLLEKRGIPAIFYIATGFIDAGTHKGLPMCGWDDLRKLVAHPLATIGGHTASHPDLGRLPDAKARAEIADGKAKLEDRLGLEVRHFAYPKGRYHAGTPGLVRETGFATAVTVEAGPLDPLGDPYRIRRVSVDRGLPAWAFGLAGGRAHSAFTRAREAWA